MTENQGDFYEIVTSQQDSRILGVSFSENLNDETHILVQAQAGTKIECFYFSLEQAEHLQSVLFQAIAEFRRN